MYESFRKLGNQLRMPGLGTRILSAAKATGRVVKSGVRNNQLFVGKETLQKRKAACLSCDKEADGWCGVCGCMLDAKQRLATEKCPLGLWGETG